VTGEQEVTEFPPAAAQPARRDPNMCIANSVDAATLRPELAYAEGIAKGYGGCWYAHAWNVNAAGEAVDCTWEHAGTRYLGRVIDAAAKWEACVARGVWDFEYPLPWVPDGETGVGCRTRAEADWFAAAAARLRTRQDEEAP